jgi:hypothetical protein
MVRLGGVRSPSRSRSASAPAGPEPSTSRSTPRRPSTRWSTPTPRSTGSNCAPWRKAGALRSRRCARHPRPHPPEVAGARTAIRRRSPARRVPAVQEGGQGPALLFLAGDLPGEDVAVDVRGDGGENQALKFGRLQRLHLPLHRATAGEGRPLRNRRACPRSRAAHRGVVVRVGLACRG